MSSYRLRHEFGPLTLAGRRRHARCLDIAARIVALSALGSLAGGCSALERLRWVGDTPPLAAIENPTTQAGYKPVQMPMPAPQPAIYQPNSLWRTGSRAFFKDQRAHQVGDILTVKVKITDKATIENETAAQPQERGGFRHRQFLRQAEGADHEHPGADPHLHRRLHLARATARARSTARRNCSTNVAGVVTQVLPNGNLVIEGKQEVRVNFEIRELIVAGIVRPGGHRERQHHRLHARSPRPASPMAAAARSPTCSSRATASRCSTCCCRSDC